MSTIPPRSPWATELRAWSRIAVAASLTFLMGNAMNVVDVSILGHLDEDPRFPGANSTAFLTGAALANTWMSVMDVGLYAGFAQAVNILSSQAYGAKNFALADTWLRVGVVAVLLASVLRNVGRVHGSSGRAGKAVEALEEALRIHRVAGMRTGGPAPSSASSREVARILGNLAEVHLLGGDLTSARDRYVESLGLLRSLEGAGDEREEGRNARRRRQNQGRRDRPPPSRGVEIALVLGGIGEVHRLRGEHDECRVVLGECMRAFEGAGVPHDNARVAEARSRLVDAELASARCGGGGTASGAVGFAGLERARAVDALAEGYRACGDVRSALWFYAESLTVRRRALSSLGRSALVSSTDDEDDDDGEDKLARVAVDVAYTLSRIGQIKRDGGEFAAAGILFDEAGETLAGAGVPDGHGAFRDLMAEVERMRNM